MSAARAFVAALAVAALFAAPALAQPGPRAVVVYPVASASGAASEVADVTSLLDAALRRLVLRNDDIVLTEPLFIRGTCGPATSASLPCLAALSGNGLVLRVTVHRSQSILVVALEAVDARARTFGPVTVSVDAYAQSTEPLVRAMIVLMDQVSAASKRSDARAGVPLPPPPAAAVARPPPPAEKPPVVAEKPAAAAAPPIPAPPIPEKPAVPAPKPAAVAEKPPALAAPPAAKPPPPAEKPKPSLAVTPKPPPAAEARAPVAVAGKPSGAGGSGAWMRTAGPILTGAGAAILAGGIAISVMNHSLSNQLERKFAAGTLTAADLDQYRKVERNDQMTKLLLGAGGALTLGGVAVWTAAPSRGSVAAGVSGTF
jgi:outer membrane biosynthesis protein TonB